VLRTGQESSVLLECYRTTNSGGLEGQENSVSNPHGVLVGLKKPARHGIYLGSSQIPAPLIYRLMV